MIPVDANAPCGMNQFWDSRVETEAGDFCRLPDRPRDATQRRRPTTRSTTARSPVETITPPVTFLPVTSF